MLHNLYAFYESIVYTVKNIKPASIFLSCIVKLFTVFIGVGIAREIFYLSLSIADMSHFGADNAWKLFINPLSLVVFIMYLFLIVCLVCIEMYILIKLAMPNRLRYMLDIRKALLKLIKPNKSFAVLELILFISYIILTIRLGYIGISLSLTSTVYMPTFFIDEFLRTGNFKYFVHIISAFILYLNVRFMYTLPIFIMEDKNFSICLWESFQRTKLVKLYLIDILSIMFIIGVIYIIKAFIYKVFVNIGLVMNDMTSDTRLYALLLSTLNFINIAIEAVLKLSIVAVLIRPEIIKHEEEKINKSIEPKKHILLVTAAVFSSIMLIVGNFLYQNIRLEAMRLNSDLRIVAHRGFTAEAVENSMESLENAKKAGLEYVEVDIMLTKDHKFIVMHDFNLFRLAKRAEDVKDMLYEDLIGIEISNNGFSSKIVSFEEYAKKAKELGMNLIVELKLHGSEPENYPDIFITKMRELGIDDRYKVISLELDTLEEIKKRAPYMELGYIMPFHFGDLVNADVDFFVLEDFSYRESLALQALLLNKQIYVWTVNKPDLIEKYMYCPVAGIISDYPDLVKEIKEEAGNHDSLLSKLISIVNKDL